MALPDSHYVVAFPPQILFRDKDTGLPLSAGKVYFYKDTDRSILKDVYQQVQLPDNTYEFVPLPNPIILTSIGTFGDDSGNDILIYTFPYMGTPSDPGEEPELYFVEVYSSDDVLQFTREAYPPNAISSAGGAVDAVGNEVLNPQFVQVLFDVPSGSTVYTVTVSGSDYEIDIAPNWTLVTTGSGTVTLKQVGITNTDVITNPPYALQVSTAGSITDVYIRQRLTASPRLLYGANLQGSIVASGVSPTSIVNLTMSWIPSAGSSYTFFSKSTESTGGFSTLSGTIALDETANPDVAPNGYIDLKIAFTPITTVQITSVQVIEIENTSSESPYIQESTPKQINGLFSYYLPQLEFKPIPSLLTGWDFALNPSQFGTSGNLSGSGAYIWDQTIGARGATNIAYTRNGSTGGLQFTTAGAVPDAFYILQYLTGPEAEKMVGTRLSVNLCAFRHGVDAAVTCRIYLYRAATADTIPTLGTTIGTLASNGVFTVNHPGWTEIGRSDLGTPVFNLDTVVGTDYGYSGWEITDPTEISDTHKFAIVVTFSYTAVNTFVTVDSVSLVPGDIPTRPAPQKLVEVLRECERYYETNYPYGVAPGTITPDNYQVTQQNLSGTNCRATTFDVLYRTEKVTPPTATHIAFYSPITGTIAVVRAFAHAVGVGTNVAEVSTGNWTLTGFGTKSFTMLSNTATNLATQAGASEAYIIYNWTADARLGIV